MEASLGMSYRHFGLARRPPSGVGESEIGSTEVQ